FTSYMCFFLCSPSLSFYSLVFFSLAAPPVIYTLSLHDALPIYGLPENGAPPLGGRTADVAQVDLVVFPAELPMLPNERVQPLEGGTFLGEGSDVQDLCGTALGPAFQAHLVHGQVGLVPANPLQRLDEDGCRDEIGLQDHHRPLPASPVAGLKGAPVVGPPEPFQGHDRVVDAAVAAFHHELGRIRSRKQRF